MDKALPNAVCRCMSADLESVAIDPLVGPQAYINSWAVELTFKVPWSHLRQLVQRALTMNRLLMVPEPGSRVTSMCSA